MSDRFVVQLTENHRRFLDALIDSGRCSPGTITRALILQQADEAQVGSPACDGEIARTVHASHSTVYRVRKRFAERGFQAALFPQGRPPLHRILAPFAGG